MLLPQHASQTFLLQPLCHHRLNGSASVFHCGTKRMKIVVTVKTIINPSLSLPFPANKDVHEADELNLLTAEMKHGKQLGDLL